jgi:hypothetical protein
MSQMDEESKNASHDCYQNLGILSENNKNGTKFFDSNNDSHSEEKNDLFSHYNGNNNFPLDFHNDKSQNNYCSFYIFKENYNKNDDELDMNDKSFIEQNNNLENINENIKNINTITLSTGKVINTINQIMSNVMNELFNSNEIDYEKKNDMQLLKIKKKRRTKSEILNEKDLKLEKKEEVKKRGRIKKNATINPDNVVHTKNADDNILKKINSCFIETIRNWLNNSFIDKKGNFLVKQNEFLKINQKLNGYTNLKKIETTKLMKMKFKEIFNVDISIKYTKISPDHNKILISNIYHDNEQYFIIFILELTFIEGFNIFIGQINYNDFRQLFKSPIDEKKVDLFFNKFDKIDVFLKKIYEEGKSKNTREKLKDYIQRICILCINYENWFERKFNRKSNTKSKTND